MEPHELESVLQRAQAAIARAKVLTNELQPEEASGSRTANTTQQHMPASTTTQQGHAHGMDASLHGSEPSSASTAAPSTLSSLLARGQSVLNSLQEQQQRADNLAARLASLNVASSRDASSSAPPASASHALPTSMDPLRSSRGLSQGAASSLQGDVRHSSSWPVSVCGQQVAGSVLWSSMPRAVGEDPRERWRAAAEARGASQAAALNRSSARPVGVEPCMSTGDEAGAAGASNVGRSCEYTHTNTRNAEDAESLVWVERAAVAPGTQPSGIAGASNETGGWAPGPHTTAATHGSGDHFAEAGDVSEEAQRSTTQPLFAVAQRLALLQAQQQMTLHQLLNLRLEQLRLRQQQLAALQELLRSELEFVRGTPLQLSAVHQALQLLSQSLGDMHLAAAAIHAGRDLVDVANIAETVSRADARAEEVSRMARQLLAVLREFPNQQRGNEEQGERGRGDGNAGATDEDLQELPTVICAEGSLFLGSNDSEAEACGICLTEYKVGDKLKSVNGDSCVQHLFHAACLDEWLRIRICCPSCRAPMHRAKDAQQEDQQHQDPQGWEAQIEEAQNGSGQDAQPASHNPESEQGAEHDHEPESEPHSELEQE